MECAAVPRSVSENTDQDTVNGLDKEDDDDYGDFAMMTTNHSDVIGLKNHDNYLRPFSL